MDEFIQHLRFHFSHLHPLIKLMMIIVAGIILAIIAEIIARIHEKRLNRQDAKRYSAQKNEELL